MADNRFAFVKQKFRNKGKKKNRNKGGEEILTTGSFVSTPPPYLERWCGGS